MNTTNTFPEALAALTEAFGKSWMGNDTQARFDIQTGIKHTAIDVIDTEGLALLSVHSLPPFHAGGFNPDHAEFVAGLLEGCLFKQSAYLPGPLAKRHRPTPELATHDQSGD
jgi:hypothetical protein